MNDVTLKELKIVVERAVRPVRATMARKRQMREELLAHLTAIFEEEAETLGDEQAALDQAKRRFGDPRELTGQLQQAVPRWERACFVFAKYIYQPGDSALRLAAMSVLCMCLMIAGMLLTGLVISMLRGKLSELGLFAHVSLVVGVLMAAFMFVFIFLTERIGRALFGEKAERSLFKVVLYCLASLVIFPALAFVAQWADSFDLAASLAHLRFACCFAPATPLFFLLMGRQMMEEMRFNQEWANLEIGE